PKICSPTTTVTRRILLQDGRWEDVRVAAFPCSECRRIMAGAGTLFCEFIRHKISSWDAPSQFQFDRHTKRRLSVSKRRLSQQARSCAARLWKVYASSTG